MIITGIVDPKALREEQTLKEYVTGPAIASLLGCAILLHLSQVSC